MKQIYENSRYVMSALTSRIMGCAIKVHKVLGPGYEESYYQRALVIELVAAGLSVRREVELQVYYRDQLLGKKRVDLVVDDCIVELKAKKALEEIDAAQVVSYLKASGFPIALLINFGTTKVQAKRFANTAKLPSQPLSASDSVSHSVQRLSDSESRSEHA